LKKQWKVFDLHLLNSKDNWWEKSPMD
jgi:hypothetical protein